MAAHIGHTQLAGSAVPQHSTFAHSKDDVLNALSFYFGQPVSPEKLKDYGEHHAATCTRPRTHTTCPARAHLHGSARPPNSNDECVRSFCSQIISLMPTPAPTRTRRSFWPSTCTRAVVASTAASHRLHPNSSRSQPDPRHHQQPHREVAAELAHHRRSPLPPHRGHGACSPHKPNARDPSKAHTITTQSDNQTSCFVIAGR